MYKTEQITIRITTELKQQLETYCALNRVPIAQYIRNLVIKDLDDWREREYDKSKSENSSNRD